MGDRGDIEKWPVFRDALELGEIAERVAARIEAKRPDIADHLRRSSSSVLLNLGEGGREYSAREKAKAYRVGQRESGECSAAFALLERIGLGDDDTHRGHTLANSIADQITGLCRAVLKRAPPATDKRNRM